MKIRFSIVILLFGYFTGTAQDYLDLVKLSYDRGFERPYEGVSGEGGFTEAVLDATLPIPLGELGAIVTGFNFEHLKADYDPDGSNTTLYGLMLKVGLNLNHTDEWSGTYIFLPKISSDLENIRQRDYQYGALALLKQTRSPNFNIKFGMYYNGELSGPLFVPLFGLYRKWGPHELNMTLPLAFDYNYQLRERVKAGIQFNGIVKSFLIDGPQSTYVHKANNETALYLQPRLGPIHVQLMAGIAIGRYFRLYEEGDQLDFAISAIKIGDDRDQLNYDFKDGAFAKIVLIYRLALPNN